MREDTASVREKLEDTVPPLKTGPGTAGELPLPSPLLLDASTLPEEALERMARALPPSRREAAVRRRGTARREATAASYLALFALLRPEGGEGGPSFPSLEELLEAERAVAQLAEKAGWPVGPYGQPFPGGCFLPGGALSREEGDAGSPRHPRYVSLAHSGGTAAAAAYPAPVGLDLQREVPSPPDRLRRIAGKFHPAERERLACLTEEALPAAFRRLWAEKESVLKLCGRGLSLPLSAFCVGEDGTGTLEGRAFRIAGWETEAGSLAAAVWAE